MRLDTPAVSHLRAKKVEMDPVGALWEHPRGMAGLEEEQLLEALVADPDATPRTWLAEKDLVL